MLLAAAAGSLRHHAGRVSIDGRYASIVTLVSLRRRGLIAAIGTRPTSSGLEAIAYHRLG